MKWQAKAAGRLAPVTRQSPTAPESTTLDDRLADAIDRFNRLVQAGRLPGVWWGAIGVFIRDVQADPHPPRRLEQLERVIAMHESAPSGGLG